MVSSAIPIITFRYYPYKKKKLTFWVSLLSIVIFQCRLFAEYGIDNMGICLVVLSSVEAIIQIFRSNSNTI